MTRRLLKKLMTGAGDGWTARALNGLIDAYEARHGTLYAQKHYRRSLARGRSIKAALACIEARWPGLESASAEKPVFILSAGWRSGSTLLQRLVMSKQRILIWGEPYSHALMLRHLSDGLSAITDDWPEQRWFLSEYDLEKLDSTFVANLYPEIADLQRAYLAYMQTLFVDPAKAEGFDQWGIKDVRLDIDDARFLQWLYPRAKFLFLVRNPYHAYRSYRLARNWYHEWPQDPVMTATRFARHWHDLAKGFHEEHDSVGGMLLRYEDIASGNLDFRALEDYLEVAVDPALTREKVGSHRRDGDRVPKREIRMLTRELRQVAAIFGYSPE